MNDKAAVARRDAGEVDLGGETAGLAEHHIAVAGIAKCVAGAVAIWGPDDQVVEAVAVDVAGRGDRSAGEIARVLPVDDKAADARCDVDKIDGHAQTPSVGCITLMQCFGCSALDAVVRPPGEAWAAPGGSSERSIFNLSQDNTANCRSLFAAS